MFEVLLFIFICIVVRQVQQMVMVSGDGVVLENLRDDQIPGGKLLKQGTQSSKKADSQVAQILERYRSKASIRDVLAEAVIGSVVGALVAVYVVDSLVTIGIFSFLGLCVGYLYGHSRFRRKMTYEHEAIERLLPVVMERLVMAAQAGLDIIAAIKAVVHLQGRDSSMDPVTELLSIVMQLTESGLRFNAALEQVAAKVADTSLKHAFVHLAVAYEQGGELVPPLRELSDATQIQYQEVIEERIAKLPVKATLPLLCTFAGVLIFFITTPLLQVLRMMQEIAVPLH